jgi:hypothetical protein
MDLRLSYDTTNEKMDFRNYLNENIVRGPMMAYIKTKMKVDPQIEFWFE